MTLHFSIEVKVSKFDKNPENKLEHLIHSTKFVCNIGCPPPPWISDIYDFQGGPTRVLRPIKQKYLLSPPPQGQIPEYAPDLIQS